jgi:ABC-type nitrate/sulfonate/bicarbonate transport system ATPase subunit
MRQLCLSDKVLMTGDGVSQESRGLGVRDDTDGALDEVVSSVDDLLALQSVTVDFRTDAGPFRALEDVSLTVRTGEFVSIVGRSGCGKSTLFNAAAGLITPTQGHVLFRNEHVDGRPGHAGYMLQRDLLFPWRRLIDNVALGCDVLRRDRKASRERARELLPRFGLDRFERSYPSELSGGMRQRAALLRTLLLDREMLLLDEPFGALDAITRAEMQSWLLSIWDEFRRTVLFITHDVDEAVYLSDRVIVMAGPPGKVVADIEIPISRPRIHDDVVTSAAFADLKHQLLDVIAERDTEIRTPAANESDHGDRQ